MGKALSVHSNEWAQRGFQDFIVPEYIDAPYTTIQNRAKVLDYSKMPIPRMGVERISFNSIEKSSSEFGPNGEEVFEIENKDSRIRFISNWVPTQNANGSSLYASIAESYLEVTIYGTGLNILTTSSGADRTVYVDVNGVVGNEDIYTQSSDVLSLRNYNTNIVRPAKTGLTLGWHTLKVWTDGGNPLQLQGIEILNESTQVGFSQGSAFSGTNKFSNPAAVLKDYKAGIVGTKGGRVSWYIHKGIVKSAATEVDATPKYLALTDHSNEEEVRRYNWREFGANVNWDFSTLSTNRDSSFTLEDGATTLIGENVQSYTWLDVEGVLPIASGFLTFTFVGTGLDVNLTDNGTGGSDSVETYVDGVLRDTRTVGKSGWRRMEICSGLPYGTHVVKFLVVSALSWGQIISDFIVYQPKTPEKPTGAVSLGAYNVMADFVTNTGVTTQDIATGILRKINKREFVYTGNWTWADGQNFNIGGTQVYSSSSGDTLEYSFFGTGIDFRYYGNPSRTNSIQVTLDDTITDFSSHAASAYGGTFTKATGILNTYDVSIAFIGGLVISGLDLGFHKIKFTNNQAALFTSNAIDIITPIHSHSEKGIGSLSLDYNKEIQPVVKENPEVDWSKAKALLVYDQASNKVIYSKNIRQVLDVTTGTNNVYFEKPFENENYIMIGSPRVANRGLATSRTRASYTQLEVSLTTTGALNDATYMVGFFGELEGEE